MRTFADILDLFFPLTGAVVCWLAVAGKITFKEEIQRDPRRLAWIKKSALILALFMSLWFLWDLAELCR